MLKRFGFWERSPSDPQWDFFPGPSFVVTWFACRIWSTKLQMRLLCHWMHYACEKLSVGCLPLSLWLNHRTQARFYVGHGTQLPPKPWPCIPNISAYRCKKERSSGLQNTQNAFSVGYLPGLCWGDHDASPNPASYSQLGRGNGSPVPSALATRTRRLRRLGLERALPSLIFSSIEQRVMEHLTIL